MISFVLDGYAPAGRRGAERRGDRGPLRAPLRPADPAPLRPGGHRATVARFYNTTDEIDHLASVLHRLAGASGSPRR